jgi:hypothetical protein
MILLKVMSACVLLDELLIVIAASHFSRKNGKDSCIGTVKSFNYNQEFNYNFDDDMNKIIR